VSDLKKVNRTNLRFSDLEKEKLDYMKEIMSLEKNLPLEEITESDVWRYCLEKSFQPYQYIDRK
jgi:hypothetical protein